MCVAGAAPAAHAGVAGPGYNCTQDSDCTTGLTCQAGTCQSSGVNNAPSAVSGTDAAGIPNNNLAPTAPIGYSLNGWMAYIVQLFAWLLGVAALDLDSVVYITVVAMGNYVRNLAAVDATWRILRDIGNIVLIFGFLALGITTILDVNWYGDRKKLLPMLLVVAVFLNFSLFISEAVIDTGNLFATQFYTQINGGQPAALAAPTLSSINNEGISNAIMTSLGLQTIEGDAKNPSEAAKLFKDSFTIGFMSILLFLVAAFVMFSLSFILIARFVILIFLIITAPIGFAGLIVPKLSGTAKKWWSTLFQQTITAPVLLLLLYIALRVITDGHFLIGMTPHGVVPSWTGTSTNNIPGFASMMISFLIGMGLLAAVVIVAKEMSAFGADHVMKIGKNAVSGATNFAKRSTLGTGKYVARKTAGHGLHAASQAVLRSDFGQTQAGRLIAAGLGRGGKAFKEDKERSVKKHEEYQKSVAAAIEEKHAPAIAAAQRKRGAEDSKIQAAKTEHETAVKEAQPLINEVKRLEEQLEYHKNKGNLVQMSQTKQALQKAKEAAAPAEKMVGITSAKFTLATKFDDGLATAEEQEKQATEALAAAKKKAALGYAQNLQTRNPFTWAVAGAGQNVAANKIIRNALKSQAAKDKDLLRKVFETVEKETSEGEKEQKTTEVKSGAPKP